MESRRHSPVEGCVEEEGEGAEMNQFLKKIKAASMVRDGKQHSMSCASRRIMEAMGLDQQALESAHRNKISWTIAGFRVSVRSFPWNGWTNILVFCPVSDEPGKVGYSNTPDTLPEDWGLESAGTDTRWNAPEEATKAICQEARKLRAE